MNHLCYSFIRWVESDWEPPPGLPIKIWDAHQEEENHGYYSLGSVP